jgi:hypothetical protein
LSQVAPKVFAVVANRAARAPDRALTAASSRAAEVEEVIVQTSRYRLATDQLASRTFLTQGQVKEHAAPRRRDAASGARLPGTTTNGFSSIGSVRGGEPNGDRDRARRAATVRNRFT